MNGVRRRIKKHRRKEKREDEQEESMNLEACKEIKKSMEEKSK